MNQVTQFFLQHMSFCLSHPHFGDFGNCGEGLKLSLLLAHQCKLLGAEAFQCRLERLAKVFPWCDMV